MINLVYPVKVDEIFNLIVRDRIVRDYLGKLRANGIYSYLHSINVCFHAIDMGIKEGYSDDDLVLLGYCGVFRNIGRFYMAKNDTTCLVPRRSFLTLKGLNYELVARIVVASFEYMRKYSCPRKGGDRRKGRRVDKDDRRRYDEKVFRMAQLVSLASLYDNFVSLTNESSEMLEFPNYSDFLRREFLGDSEYRRRFVKGRLEG